MKVLVSVTADDIANGVPENACKCPVHRGISRALPWMPPASAVGPLGLTLASLPHHSGYIPPIPLPETARVFMARFDAGQRVKPFEFEIDVPGEIIPAGAS